MRKTIQKQITTILLAFMIAIGLWYLFSLLGLAKATRFIADDYCSYNSAASLGWPRFMWFWFITWGGRLSAVSADMLLVWLGQSAIGYVSFFAVLGWVVVDALIIHGFIKEESDRTTRVLISVAGALVLVYAITRAFPNFIQTLFWFSAFRTHTLPLILFNLWLYLALKASGVKCFQTPILIGLFLFAFGNAAFSEVFTTLQVTTLGGYLAWRILTAPKNWSSHGNRILMAGLSGGIFGLALMLFAPGTVNREALLVGERSISALLSISVEGSLNFYRVVLKDPYRALGLLSILMFAFSAGPIFPKIRHQRLSAGWLFTLYLIMGPLLVFISFLPGAYGMGESIPRRAFPIPIFFSLMPLIVAVMVAGQNFAAKRAPTAQTLGLALGLLLLTGSWVGSLPSIANDQNRMQAYAYSIQALESAADAAVAAGETELVVPPLGNWAGVYDPSDNPKFWVTKCFSEYYDIQIIGPEIK